MPFAVAQHVTFFHLMSNTPIKVNRKKPALTQLVAKAASDLAVSRLCSDSIQKSSQNAAKAMAAKICK